MKKISQLPAGHTLTGTEMVPLVQDGQTRQVPAGYFGGGSSASEISFPAHSSLSTSDVGKLVMNVGGSLRVAQTEAGRPGQAGKWQVALQPPVAPQQAEFLFKLMFETPITDGQSFSVYGTSFTFRIAPDSDYDVAIDPDSGTATANALFVKLNTMGTTRFLQVASEAESDGRTYTLRAGSDYPGASGDNPMFTSTADAFTLVTQKTTGKNNDLDHVGKDLLLCEKSQNGSGYYGSIILSYVLQSSTAAYGPLIGGYRWPSTQADMAQNLQLYLNTNSAFQTYFSSTVTGASVEISERNAPETLKGYTNVTASGGSPVSVSVTVLKESQLPQGAFAVYPILGVLKAVSGNIAKIDNGRMFKVRLSPASSAVSFDGTLPAKLDNRALVPADNGTVKQGAPESDNFDYYSNGVFLALEEAAPGNELLVEWVKILGH